VIYCSTQSQRKLKPFLTKFYYQIKNLDVPLPKTEGLDSMEWILLDYFDVVVHVMTEELRNYYKLDKLWSDAKFFTLDEDEKLIVFKTELLKKMFLAPTVYTFSNYKPKCINSYIRSILNAGINENEC